MWKCLGPRGAPSLEKAGSPPGAPGPVPVCLSPRVFSLVSGAARGGEAGRREGRSGAVAVAVTSLVDYGVWLLQCSEPPCPPACPPLPPRPGPPPSQLSPWALPLPRERQAPRHLQEAPWPGKKALVLGGGKMISRTRLRVRAALRQRVFQEKNKDGRLGQEISE
ncbi:max dimerization protein 4 isoform X2 [Macrotis lagotis]|uniref:max dimerization protein 4 isoform X2 n=1 Tax=Macrotis lagotis TaxID=92651 RepID=UPI003D68022E